MQTADKEKYELRSTEPDEIVAATPTYIFLSKWGLPIFIFTLAVIIMILFSIKIPSTFACKITLTYSSLNKTTPRSFYGKMPVSENLLTSIAVNSPVAVEFYNLGDSKKYVLKGAIDTIYIDQNTLHYYAGVSISDGVPESLFANPTQKIPATATIIFSKKTILGHLFQ